MRKAAYRTILSLIIGFFFLSASCMTGHAAEQTDRDGAGVLLLDASGSMKSNDPDRLAIDDIVQMTYTLPTRYRVGLVVYGAEITAEQEMVENGGRGDVAAAAKGVEYKGYSNAGSGLLRAVELLLEDAGEDRHIVMFSDGEILMDSEEMTEASAALFQSAVEQAEEADITIHVIGLGGDMEDTDNSVFTAADRTGGQSFHAAQAGDIQKAVDLVLSEGLAVKRSAVAVVEAGGGTETVGVKLPYAHADKLRVLLTSDSPIRNVSANFQAESAQQFNGERHALIEIENPLGEELEISFEGVSDRQVKISVIPEYYVDIQAEITYTDKVPEKAEETQVDQILEEAEETLSEGRGACYERTARIVYTFSRADNENIVLWNTEYFDHNKVAVTINGEKRELALNEGRLEMEERVTDSCEYEAWFDYSQLPVNVAGTDTVRVELEGAPSLPEPEEEPKPPYLLIGVSIVLLLILLLSVIFFLWLRQRPRPVPEPSEERPEPSRYSFAGMLKLYITRTRTGYDIPPLSYNLFRTSAGRVISLQEIIKDCDVKEEFPGAEAIYFKAGANRTLILTNNSDCTIMKNREILMKKQSYQLPLDSKVDISFEDEISELTFQYKET